MPFQIDLPAGLRNSSMVDPPKGSPQNWRYLISTVWSQFMQEQIFNRIQAAPQLVGEPIGLTAQTATIPATPINIGDVSGSLYRLSYYVRITSPAAVSNSVTVNFGFTDDGVSCTFSGTPVTALSTAAVGTGVFMIESDQSSPITYSVTYASNPAGQMVYKLDILAELLQ